MHVQMLLPMPSRRTIVIPADDPDVRASSRPEGPMMAQGVTQVSDGTRPRAVWTFAESDYRFGAGPLLMTVDQVDWSAPVQQDGEVWYEVTGVEFATDGRVVGPRRTMVRAGRLGPLRRQMGR
jgi:hypothetical protein